MYTPGSFVLARHSNLLDIARQLHLAILQGGGTINAMTGAAADRGFAVSVKGAELVTSSPPSATLIKQWLIEYADMICDTLHEEGFTPHLGCWVNPENGKVYLDVSLVLDTEEAAEAAALDHGQLAYYVLHEARTVFVDTGEPVAV